MTPSPPPSKTGTGSAPAQGVADINVSEDNDYSAGIVVITQYYTYLGNGLHEKAYELYLRTARLDLDDYNHDVHEGCHITSMAGTWLSVVQGFGGMRNFDNTLSFSPTIPKQWESYSFKINYRGATIKVFKSHEETKFINLSDIPVTITVNDKKILIASEGLVTYK